MHAKMTWMLMVGMGLIVGLSVGCNKPKEEPPIVQTQDKAPPPFPESSVPAPEAQPPKTAANTNPPPPPVETATPPVDSGAKKSSAKKSTPAPKEQYATKKKASSSGKTHTVTKGETLQTISQKYYGTTKNWRKIYNANKKEMPKGPDDIKVGMKLKIP